MAADPLAIYLTILGMAVVTYVTKAGGFLLMRWMPPTRAVRAWLEYIPGSVLVALVAPSILGGTAAEVAGAITAALAMLVTRQPIIGMIAGIAAVAIARALT